MDSQQKVLNAFIGKVVRKDLAFLVKGGLPVPTYVLEYLLGQYCASDDEEIINEGLEKVKDVIKNNYVHRAEAESVKGLIREHGKHRIIDKVTVVLNEKNDEYQATFANLGLSGVPIGTLCTEESEASERKRCMVHRHHWLHQWRRCKSEMGNPDIKAYTDFEYRFARVY